MTCQTEIPADERACREAVPLTPGVLKAARARNDKHIDVAQFVRLTGRERTKQNQARNRIDLCCPCDERLDHRPLPLGFRSPAPRPIVHRHR